MKQNTNISLTTFAELIIKNWLTILITSITFALLAYFSSIIFFKPKYISEASISVGINFKEVGHLSQYEQDQFIGQVEYLLISDEITLNTLEKLSIDEGIKLEYEDFLSNRILERQSNLLNFKYVSSNPNLPQKVVSAWMNTGYAELEGAYSHALGHQHLIDLQSAYLSCYQTTSSQNTEPMCSDLLTKLPTEQEILIEKELSKGLFPGLIFSKAYEQAPTAYPIRQQTSLIVLGGFFIGFFGCIIYLLLTQKVQ